MADLVMIVVTMVFFAGCVGYVSLCDRIIGPDEALDDTLGDDGSAVTAPVPGTRSADGGPKAGSAVAA